MDPTGFFAAQVAHRDTHSARPDAPVVLAERRRAARPPRSAAVRRAAATSLRSLAARIEPRRITDQCGPTVS